MKKYHKIFDEFAKITEFLPTPIYWLDTNCQLIGANKHFYEILGITPEYVGTTAYDVYPPDIAYHIVSHDKQVMQSGIPSAQEEPTQDIRSGYPRYYNAFKTPVRDEDGKVIGIVGTLIETTMQKESEQLRLENQRLELEKETQKIAAELEVHKKFKKIADQMAHDLGSPLMALSVLTTSCAGIPETQRNMLKESASRIRDIAGSLLSQYKPIENPNDLNKPGEVLVYAVLEQIIMDKQYEYQHLPIKFNCEHEKGSIFSFIEVDSGLFKRMLSNLINNSVEAMNQGIITLNLDSNNHEVKVSVIDNGSGMPQEVVSKLINNIAITFNKENGHGIGFTQIHDTLKQCNGKLTIDSKLGVGTCIALMFPRIEAPVWLLEEIYLNSNDTVVILDDDNSIHGAWDLRFAEILKFDHNIKIKHFIQAREAIDFINSHSKKDDILLLTDYELLKQELNGLDVIQKTHVKRSILVTSHYTEKSIIKQALQMQTKVLPKILASEVNISIKNKL